MLSLDDEDVEIALLALQFAEWRSKQQVEKGGRDGCSEVAWFCTKHCLGKFAALIGRIEQYQKDRENGDAK